MPHVRSGRCWLLAGALALALAGGVAATASAARSARNGSIVFRRYFFADHATGAVFTIAPDGTGEHQLTSPPTGTVDDQPEWSPNGSAITFTRCPASGLCHVYTVRSDGSAVQPLGAPCATDATEQSCPDDEDASYAPDGRRLALVQATGSERTDAYTEHWIEHSTLVTVAADGSDRHVIWQGAPFSGDLAYPVFSPDGKQLVFERIASTFTLNSGMRAVFVVGADGKHLRQLTPWKERAGDNPDWSPDGRWIVFRSHVDQEGAGSQIFLIHPDGSGRKQITHFPQSAMLGSTSFSPDGKLLVLGKGAAGGNLHVYTMRLDGSGLRRVTRSALWDSAPGWGSA